MKITACCITWNRPVELGRLIRCFEMQDHPDRELVIVDDALQYPKQPEGDRWRVHSFPQRFRTIGEKRAACAGLASPDSGAYAIWDDDDLYLPWALTSVAKVLDYGHWAQSRLVLEWDNDGAGPGWHKQEAFNRSDDTLCGYHSAWAFRREAYQAIGGYMSSPHEDWPIARQMLMRFGQPADSTADGRPWMAYSRGPTHLSTRIHAHHAAGAGEACFTRAWEERAGEAIEPVDLYPLIRWDRQYDQLPVPDEVLPRPW